MTSRNTCNGKQSLPPRLAVPFHKTKDEGGSLLKWLAQGAASSEAGGEPLAPAVLASVPACEG